MRIKNNASTQTDEKHAYVSNFFGKKNESTQTKLKVKASTNADLERVSQDVLNEIKKHTEIMQNNKITELEEHNKSLKTKL